MKNNISGDPKAPLADLIIRIVFMTINYDIVKVITAISAVVTLITSFFDNKKYESYQKLYFNNFLVKFYNRYKYNQKIDPIMFYNLTYSESDNYLPPYIKYLIAQNDPIQSDILVKVLIADYLLEYPNLKNIINKSLTKTFTIFYYLLYFVIFATTLFIVYMVYVSIVTFIPEYLNNGSGSISGFPDYLVTTFGILVLIGLNIFLYKNVSLNINSLDKYTSVEKALKKKIKYRKKQFVKFEKKYFF
jgi:hypothetical protein